MGPRSSQGTPLDPSTVLPSTFPMGSDPDVGWIAPSPSSPVREREGGTEVPDGKDVGDLPVKREKGRPSDSLSLSLSLEEEEDLDPDGRSGRWRRRTIGSGTKVRTVPLATFLRGGCDVGRSPFPIFRSFGRDVVDVPGEGPRFPSSCLPHEARDHGIESPSTRGSKGGGTRRGSRTGVEISPTKGKADVARASHPGSTVRSDRRTCFGS